MYFQNVKGFEWECESNTYAGRIFQFQMLRPYTGTDDFQGILVFLVPEGIFEARAQRLCIALSEQEISK